MGSLSTRVIAIIVAVVLVAGLLTLQQCQAARNARTAARLSTNQAQAGIQSGQDAVNTVGNVSASAADTDAITRSNADAIRTAKGADASVDPAASDAGLRALCLRRAYRGNAQCLRFAAPGAVEGAGAGSGPAKR